MAKKINSRDLFEKEDIFEGIRLSAQKTLEELNKVDQQFKQIAQSMRTALGSTQTNTTAGIQSFTKATEDANKAVENSIQIEKLKAQATQQALKAEQEREKVAQQKIRTQSAQAKEQERLNKIQERSAQTARNEANAYKQLEKNTRALKNESKQLGAEMLALERAGKKNTAAYQQLEARYRSVTSAAQKGDAQLKRLDKTVGDNFRNVGNYQSALGKLNGVLGAVGLGFGLNVALRQTKQLVTDSIDAFRIQEKAVKQVETGLASTNNKVGLSLQQLKDEASALQKQTLFGDEAILKDVTSILLTFTNIQGETFKSAQKNVLDLATRMDGDLKGASVQLGKALNDPIKGISALTKVGISFTEGQKEQIKTLTESGQLQEAQALILKELNTEFGGSAEAAAQADGGFTQLNNAIGDAKELLGSVIVERLKPLNAELLKFFSNLTIEDIKKFVNTLATIGKVVGNLLRMYVTFKAATMAQTLANGALSSSFVKVVQRVGIMKASLMGLQRGFGALKTAFMSNPFGILMTAAVEIYAHFEDIKALFGSVTKESQKLGKSQQDVASYSAKSAEYVAKEGTEFMKLTSELKSTNEGSEERSRLINEINKKYGTTLKNMKSERDFQEQINGEVKNYINFLKLKFKAQSLNEAMQNNFNKQLEIEAEINRLNMTIMAEGAAGGRQAEVVKAKKRQAELRMELQQTQGRFEGYAESLQKVEESLKGSNYNQSKYNDSVGAGNDELDENGEIIKKNGKATKEANTEFKKQNDYLSKQADLLEKLADIERKRKIAEIQKNIEAEIQLQSDKIKQTGEFDLTEFKRLIEEKNKLEIDRILNSADFEQEQNEIKYQREKQARIDALEDEYKTLIKGAQGNQAALKKIDENYLIEKQKLANEEVLIFNDVIEENKAITKNATDEIDALNNASLDLTKKTNEDFLKEVDEFNTKKVEGTKQATDKELEDLKKAEEEKRAIVQTTSEFFQKQSDKRIEQYENEISAAEQQYEVLKELASAGNINASESLAEQQRIIDEANRKKAQEQQRQQRIKLAESVYSTYSQKVEAGSKNPLAETIRDTTLLQQFINSLPAFMEGTEDTGTNGRGIDGKGGFQAVLHPNERVIPKHLNEQIGAISNVDLARIAQEYNNGKIVEGGNQTRSALEFAVLVNELKDLKSVIQDKPETNIELGQITNSVMEIVQSRKQGNSVTYNRFKVRK